jgi:hypothetical protein
MKAALAQGGEPSRPPLLVKSRLVEEAISPISPRWRWLGSPMAVVINTTIARPAELKSAGRAGAGLSAGYRALDARVGICA